MRDIEKKILKSLYDDIKILKRANTKTNEIKDHIRNFRDFSNDNTEEYNNLCQLNIDDVIIDSYYNIRYEFDIIIGNPPYSEAQEFIEHSFELLKENGILIFLLRTNFLASKKRFEFWKMYPLSKLYVLSKRPSFTGKGTDATSYSWFIWDKTTNKQEIKIIK